MKLFRIRIKINGNDSDEALNQVYDLFENLRTVPIVTVQFEEELSSAGRNMGEMILETDNAADAFMMLFSIPDARIG